MLSGTEDSRALKPVRPIYSNSCSAEAAADENKVEAQDEDEEEAGKRTVKIRRGPQEPTQQEILEHNATHVPFRSWCPQLGPDIRPSL